MDNINSSAYSNKLKAWKPKHRSWSQAHRVSLFKRYGFFLPCRERAILRSLHESETGDMMCLDVVCVGQAVSDRMSWSHRLDVWSRWILWRSVAVLSVGCLRCWRHWLPHCWGFSSTLLFSVSSAIFVFYSLCHLGCWWWWWWRTNQL